MDLMDAWSRVQGRLSTSSPIPAFEEGTLQFLTQAKPIQAASQLFIYIDAIEEVSTPLEHQYCFRFHVQPNASEPVTAPVWGRKALGYGDPLDSTPEKRWRARSERASWFSFSSRKKLNENQSDLFDFVLDRYTR